MTYRSESALQSACLTALKRLGFWAVRMSPTKRRGASGANSGEPGMPDLLLVEYGVWVECKLPGETLSPKQVAWHAKAARRNVQVFTTDNLEHCLAVAQWARDRAG